MTRVLLNPEHAIRGRRKNDAFILSASLPTYLLLGRLSYDNGFTNES